MTQPIHISHQIIIRLLLTGAMMALSLNSNASAQTTAFTYQGRLNGTAALQNYEVSDGLAHSHVRAIHQDREGML